MTPPLPTGTAGIKRIQSGALTPPLPHDDFSPRGGGRGSAPRGSRPFRREEPMEARPPPQHEGENIKVHVLASRESSRTLPNSYRNKCQELDANHISEVDELRSALSCVTWSRLNGNSGTSKVSSTRSSSVPPGGTSSGRVSFSLN